MPHYKSKDGAIHCLQDEAFESLLPAGSVKLSDEELQALRAAQAAANRPAERRAEIRARLSAIDVESIRAIRAVSRGKGVKADADKLDGLDAEAVALRAELAGLA